MSYVDPGSGPRSKPAAVSHKRAKLEVKRDSSGSLPMVRTLRAPRRWASGVCGVHALADDPGGPSACQGGVAAD